MVRHDGRDKSDSHNTMRNRLCPAKQRSDWAKLTSNTRAYECNPGNPTGTVYSREWAIPHRYTGQTA
jgi:bifunctional pyridoxal-dependent enzyme with beta-cystathionase and maltose regulon repressor activities